MILNNFHADVKELCKLQGLSLSKLSQKLGYTRQNLDIIIKSNIINKAYVEAVEALGYDIEIIYKSNIK